MTKDELTQGLTRIQRAMDESIAELGKIRHDPDDVDRARRRAKNVISEIEKLKADIARIKREL